DLIVSNPPYIPTGEIPGLQREVLREPATALDGGDDGLAFYRAILRHWTPLLPVGGFADFECGEDQADILCTMFSHVGNARKERDAFGADRFVTIEK
ncbi:MAG: peptide chain release factor N(5)-glutamine methyltransferase, partial [Clostridia bacterium]|nr:peptide chain release factor N(5)-glutamine methyltransferase [Clostridia bacterium]